MRRKQSAPRPGAAGGLGPSAEAEPRRPEGSSASAATTAESLSRPSLAMTLIASSSDLSLASFWPFSKCMRRTSDSRVSVRTLPLKRFPHLIEVDAVAIDPITLMVDVSCVVNQARIDLVGWPSIGGVARRSPGWHLRCPRSGRLASGRDRSSQGVSRSVTRQSGSDDSCREPGSIDQLLPETAGRWTAS